jgi:hypothetical protein
MEWEERAFFSISFSMERCGWVSGQKEMRQTKRYGLSSRGIRCSSCTPRGRRSREIRVSVTLIAVVGVGGVASRVGGAAEGVHLTIATPMALASLTIHVVVRESVVTEKTGWWMVRDVGRSRMSTLGRG